MDPVVGNESPQPRTTTTIFNSFLGRGRPRNHSQSHNAAADLGLTLNTNTINNAARELSPSPPSPIPTSAVTQRRRGPPTMGVSVSPSTTQAGLHLGHMLRRRRSASNVQPQPPAQVQTPGQGGPPAVPPAASQAQARTAPIPSATLSSPHPATGASAAAAAGSPSGTGHRLRLVPHIDSRRSLRFDPITRELRGSDPALRIGRFTDRSGIGIAAVNALSTNKIAFKSKVVSRAHAEVWVEEGQESGPKFFIRDTKSSSGTFLNHVRLSPANTDRSGHTRSRTATFSNLASTIKAALRIFTRASRSVSKLGANGKPRPTPSSVCYPVAPPCELTSAQSTAALKNLRSLGVTSDTEASSKAATSGKSGPPPVASGIPDCCICLFPVRLHQAVFLAPCSHAFHYKCMRPMLDSHHPAFNCPLCRTFADLNEEVEIDNEEEDEEFEDPGSFPAEAAKDTVTETSNPLTSLAAQATLHPGIVHTTLGQIGEMGELVGDAEGVLADDLEEAEEGDEVEEMFTGRSRMMAGAGAGAETEVEEEGPSAGRRLSMHVVADEEASRAGRSASAMDVDHDGDSTGEGSASGFGEGGVVQVAMGMGSKRKR
ncbi:unnamed protein product [Mycena citricolor]|uniref:SMAD/FHA domain-containing protein n=1 Tax=Mycena citricolor TaxID=2018698 RepID=A0AAD2HL37_9AGAR|nr:unnamed protein product [Mycena citricolor]